MSTETLRTAAGISFAVAAAALALAVLLFFFLHVPRLIGEITGRRARKEIRSISERTQFTADSSGRAVQLPEFQAGSDGAVTEDIQEETTLLSDRPGQKQEETELLSPYAGQEAPQAVPVVQKYDMQVADEILYIHTEETI